MFVEVNKQIGMLVYLYRTCMLICAKFDQNQFDVILLIKKVSYKITSTEQLNKI